MSKTCKATRLIQRVRAFRRDERGSVLVFSMFMLLTMMLAVGIAFDVIRMEVARTKLQSTLDRAVLAAADLDQTLTPQAVVQDYFTRNGMSQFLGEVTVTEGLNFRTVGAASRARVNTQFMRMVGIDSLAAIADGTADERITDVEISLVLDNSGSMGWSGNYRLDLMKEAAKQFVDIVIPDEGEGEHVVSINVIPFATQVSAGPELLSYFNATSEHDSSYCVDFKGSDFTKTGISRTASLQRTGHFDPWTYDQPVQDDNLVCPAANATSRHITVFGSDKDAIKDKIDDMWAGGNTSIDIGTKWGLALLDPDMRPVITSMIGNNSIDDSMEGRPHDFTERQVLKVMVVMSDGENTTQYMLDDDFDSGPSPFFVDGEDDWRETFYYNRSGTSYDYYYDNGNYWRDQPYLNWSRAVQLTWPEVWARMGVRRFADWTVREAIGGSWVSYFYDFTDHVSPTTKNTRTSQICAAAKAKDIVVYTVGMETYGQGDTTLADCATGPAFFFDVDATEIDQAFSAIARDISRLRLIN